MARKEQKVYLVRHGETEWSLSGQHTGVTDIPLTDNGRAAARLLRPVLAEESFALVLTSPLHRARETCELAGFGNRVHVESDLMEWNYGEYEGLTPQQINAKRPDRMIFRDGCPGEESPEQIGARVDRVYRQSPRRRGKRRLVCIWPLDGLGFLPGSCCPHYDGEANRRSSYHRLLTGGEISAGVAIEDWTGAHLRVRNFIALSPQSAVRKLIACGL